MNKQATIIVAVTLVVAMNILSFVLMGHDKHCARRGKWRVSEKTLFLVTACFGGLGGVLGMKVFHHKTRHWYFRVFYPLLLAVQIIALVMGAYLLMQ